MKSFIALLLIALVFSGSSAFAEGESFRDRIRNKVKERMAKREAEKPAPKTDALPEGNITKPGDYTLSLEHDKLTRLYKLHIPAKYTGEVATPMLIALHGGGGSMDYQANDKYYKQITKSDQEGFILVIPNGYSKFQSGKFATWNAGRCCGQARDNKVDDVGFIKALVTKLSSQLNVDKNKIFATGMSNGAMMSYRLACELPGTFKAIATVAGTDNTINCDPTGPVSVLHIHAQNDDHVLYNGGSGKGLSKNKDLVTDFVSVPETVSKWVKMNNCDEKPKRVLDIAGAHCDLYTGCKNKAEVKLCVTETGGHSWPGGEKPRGTENPSQVISANDMMWDFFKTK